MLTMTGAEGFAWQDMFIHPDEDPRGTGGIFVHRGHGGKPLAGLEAERATLTGYLRDYRLTLELKCSGLDAAAMARRSVEPSNLSLLGLVRHLSDAERGWFRRVMAGQDAPPRYRAGPGDDDDRAFAEATADPAMVAAAWQAWRDEVAFAERFVDESPSLDRTGTYDQRGGARPQISLREVIVHMIEEYARHCGHADLLRERIDGKVGL
jgi:uncharacterized damage-inducible protein DinB